MNRIVAAIMAALVYGMFLFAFLYLVDIPPEVSSERMIHNDFTCDELIENYAGCREASAMYWDYCTVYVDLAIEKDCPDEWRYR